MAEKKKTGMMEIAFTNGIVVADAKTGMVDLKSLERIGMAMAGVEELNSYSKRITVWLENKDTQEFLKVVSQKQNSAFENILNRTGKGRHSKAWGNIFVALKYAMYINKEFEYEVIDTFINNKILDFRLLGIDYHKELNIKLDILEDRIGKDNKGVYIQVAKRLKEKVFGSFHTGWDGTEDSAEFQQKRTEIQNELIFLIEKGYVKTYEQVKEYFLK